MNKRKLQIFVSSTYEDLIDHRLAAMEAILAAGHIPAAMEQFSPGDETAWDKIRNWIAESDAFMLILGGRYGSIEPASGKSYVHLEYEYAMELHKPFFALVVSDAAHERRVREIGLAVDERTHRAQYDQFRRQVSEQHCRVWNDRKDIQLTILQKLPEWSQREDLIGWVRGDTIVTAKALNEMATLSEENRALRSQLAAREESFEGLSFEKLTGLLRSEEVPDFYDDISNALFLSPGQAKRVQQSIDACIAARPRNCLDLFDSLYGVLGTRGLPIARGWVEILNAFDRLVAFGVAQKDPFEGGMNYTLTELGRRFRNRRVIGDPA